MSMIAITAYKASRNSHIGINLWEPPSPTRTGSTGRRKRQIIVVTIDDHSIFSQSNLKVGMKIDCVNGIRVSSRNYSIMDVYRTLQDAIGCVTIIASAPGIPKVVAPNELVEKMSMSTEYNIPNVEATESSDDEDDDEDSIFGDLDDRIRHLWQPLLSR
jgi:hypothetical protein